MSASPSPVDRPAVVTALRAAGCVFAEDEARLLVSAARTPGDLAAMVDRRTAGVPLEHILGWVEFCGLRIAVDPGVFVPRRRTEFLARRAAALAGPRSVVVDLCCGSGAVGAALAAIVDGIELYAADVDPAAVSCARRNLAAAGGRVYRGDLYEALPAGLRGRVDVLVANAPYVPTGEVALMPAEAREYEPRVALDGGPDGLDVVRRVTAGARTWLAPGAHLLIETGALQAPRIVDAMKRGGLIPRVAGSAELSATVVTGRRPAGRAGRDRAGRRQVTAESSWPD
jgi:release factor glutamine methyltransferase